MRHLGRSEVQLDAARVRVVRVEGDDDQDRAGHRVSPLTVADELRVVIAAAVRSVRSWGTACFVGERGQVTLDVSPDLLRRQVALVGSWTFSKQGQAECAEFVADRKVDVEKLFTHPWKLEQAEEAYKLFDTQTTGKAVILPS